jgi:hypothetical protein
MLTTALRPESRALLASSDTPSERRCPAFHVLNDPKSRRTRRLSIPHAARNLRFETRA